MQGPTLLELQKQVGVDTHTFQIVFLLGIITFPTGNLLGNVIGYWLKKGCSVVEKVPIISKSMVTITKKRTKNYSFKKMPEET